MPSRPDVTYPPAIQVQEPPAPAPAKEPEIPEPEAETSPPAAPLPQIEEPPYSPPTRSLPLGHDKPQYATAEKDQCEHTVDEREGRKCAFVGIIKKKTGKFCPNHAHMHD